MSAGFPRLFDFDERLVELSAKGDKLERLNAVVDFEMFRPTLEAAVPRADMSKHGRPPFDAVLMFKVLILQTMYSLSDERTEHLIKDRLSFMRFLGLSLSHGVPDANTIWTFREALKKANAVEALFARFDEALRAGGFLAIPAFVYKNHVSIDREHGLVRKWTATDAAARDGARLADVLNLTNTASDVWADTAYDSAKNEAILKARDLVSRIHRKKPKGKPMPGHTRRANAMKSKVRSAVEHVFAHEKGPMALMIGTIGLARARLKIGLANLAYNMRCSVWLHTRAAAG